MEYNTEIDEINLINQFNNLPNEIVLKLVLDVPINNIINLCLTDQRFNDAICNNNFFWKQKFIKDFGDVDFNISDWKLLYMTANGNNVWIFGISNIPELIPNINGRNICSSGIDKDSNFNHKIIIDSSNDAWVWGSNNLGQLGIGNYDKQFSPVKIPNIKVKEVSCSDFGTILIDVNNDVWITGDVIYSDTYTNEDNNLSTISVFTSIPNFKAKYVSMSNDHYALIDMDNNIWIAGYGSFGQLGLGPNILGPINLTLLPGYKAVKIACGRQCTIFIDDNGDIWTFGKNNFGQLGLGDFNNRFVPTKINGLKGKEIAMSAHTMVIDLEERLWGFGRNREGQLGLGNINHINVPTMITNIPILNINDNIIWKNISVTRYRSLALDSGNNIWISGRLVRYEPNYVYFSVYPGFKAFKINADGFIGIKIQMN